MLRLGSSRVVEGGWGEAVDADEEVVAVDVEASLGPNADRPALTMRSRPSLPCVAPRLPLLSW